MTVGRQELCPKVVRILGKSKTVIRFKDHEQYQMKGVGKVCCLGDLKTSQFDCIADLGIIFVAIMKIKHSLSCTGHFLEQFKAGIRFII
jgi:hypothetical protein